MSVQIEVSYGELIDKITILEIKLERIADKSKQTNIQRELLILNQAWAKTSLSPDLVANERSELRSINEALWDIEDNIRHKEAAQSFDDAFIEIARSVYRTNDERSVVKRAINEKLGSHLVEEKSYQPY